MCLHVPVILFTGGRSASLHAGIHTPPGPEAGTPPPGPGTPSSRTRLAATTALTRPCDGTGGLLKREACRSKTATDVMVRLKGP